MADLNEFFARKDKNKSKNTKFTTVNDIDKKLREMDLKREKAQRQHTDDEWKRVEEKKKDYTGLKIQNTTLEEGEDGTESDMDGEDSSCPWSAIAQNNEPTGIPIEVEDNPTQKETRVWKIIEAPAQDEKPPQNVRPLAYVPPHLRKMSAATERKKKGKGFRGEDVENTFPSLPQSGSANFWEKKKIQEPHFSSNNALKVNTENKYETLKNMRD